MKQREQTLGIRAYLGRIPIFRKILGGMVLALLISVGVTTLMTVAEARRGLYAGIRSDIALRAAVQRDRVAAVLLQYAGFARAIAENETLAVAAGDALAAYAADPAVTIKAIDGAWARLADDSVEVQGVLSPDLNVAVSQLFKDTSFALGRVEVLVTDHYGALVAATYRPEHYDQSQTDWWQALDVAARSDIHIGVPVELAELDWVAVPIVVPLYMPDSVTLVGFVCVLSDAAPLDELMDVWWRLDAGIWGKLAVDAQTVLAGRSYNISEAEITGDWFEFTLQRKLNHWEEIPFANGSMALVGDAALADADIARGENNPLADLGWLVLMYQPVQPAYQPIRGVTNTGVIFALLLLGLAVVWGVFVARIAAVPAEQLRLVVEQEAAGDQNITAWIYAEDELGQVARGINRLLTEKQSLQTQVAQRDADQEQIRSRRQRDIAATTAVGGLVAATLDIGQLVQAVVDLLRERFNLYFMGLFLMNESQTRAVLQAGTGEAGGALLARSYCVQVGVTLIGECVVSGEAQLDSALVQHEGACVPELPYAQSELALPLRSRGEMLGVLWALSYHTDTFDDNMTLVLQTIADQVAVAIDSIRLFDAGQEADARLQRVYRDTTHAAWSELTRARDAIGAGYAARLADVKRLSSATPDLWRAESRAAWEAGALVHGEVLAAEQERYLALPILSRDEVIGVINVAKPVAFGDWTGDELAQLEALTVQLGIALENARLYEEAQNRALRQRMMTDVSSRIRSSLDVENVLQIAVQEMRTVLDLEFAEVRLSVDLGGQDGERG